MNNGIVIIGTGICGTNAAFSARQAGFEGSITLIGSDPEYPYERPPLSKWDKGQIAYPRSIYSRDEYLQHGITIKRGVSVQEIDRVKNLLVLEDKTTITYSKLLIATGARPRQLNTEHWITNIDLHYLRDYQDAKALQSMVKQDSKILVIGAGFIGLELAASLAPICKKITVIEAEQTILSRALPSKISQTVLDIHQKAGVEVLNGAIIRGVNVEGDIKFVALSDGTEIGVDIIIVGIGSVPNTELAESAGLPVENGILVDMNFQTSDIDIFAAGDCCTSLTKNGQMIRFESWQVAADQGDKVGKIISGKTPHELDPPWFWSDQFEHTIQAVGIKHDELDYIERRPTESSVVLFQVDDHNRLVFAVGIGKGLEISKDIKLAQRIISKEANIDRSILIDPTKSLKMILQNN